MTEEDKKRSRATVKRFKILWNIVAILELGFAAWDIYHGHGFYWLFLIFAFFFIYRLYGLHSIEKEADKRGMTVHEYIDYRRGRES